MRTKKRYTFVPDYIIPPGETLRETIEELGMTQKELALRAELTPQSVSRIIKGEQTISYETAHKFEKVTGVPAHFWNALEAQYRENVIKNDTTRLTKEEKKWLETIPFRELIKRGVLEKTTNTRQLFENVLRFFGVNSVNAWYEMMQTSVVTPRQSHCFETHPGPAMTWIRLGELQAINRECNEYNRSLFQTFLQECRTFTCKPLHEIMDIFITRCAEYGVAISLVSTLKKVPWNGATKWISPYKVMIVLSDRGKTEDIFWFSFFHEASHVLHDSKKMLFINNNSDEIHEKKADKFAAEMLIPQKYDHHILNIKNANDIRKLSAKIGVGKGIVAGRYRYLSKKWNAFPRIKCTLSKKSLEFFTS